MAASTSHPWLASEGDTRIGKVDCRKDLDDGELIDTVTIVDADGLTIDLEAASTAAEDVRGSEVPIGQAAMMRVTGMLASGSPYSIDFKIITDGSPANTVNMTQSLIVF